MDFSTKNVMENVLIFHLFKVIIKHDNRSYHTQDWKIGRRFRMRGLIYKITCLPTGLSYIGKTRSTEQQRWYQHCSDAKRGSGIQIFIRLSRNTDRRLLR